MVEKFIENEPMSRHTTFKAGGNARYFVEAETKEELASIVKYVNQKKLDYFILGNGSNVLVKDSGYDGVVIKLGKGFDEIQYDGSGRLTVAAGSLLSKTAKFAADKELTGMETLSGIPGTVGGAVVMNAGAYGGEISDVIESAVVMDEDGEVLVLGKKELEMSYRHSIISDRKYIVLTATFVLEKGDKAAIEAKMKECQDARREKQPLEYPSAGSTFKRPEGYFAGKLIMDAGLRGYSVGGAKVSDKHCGFVINEKNASATDILDVMEYVQKTVYEKFGVMLEPEVKILG